VTTPITQPRPLPEWPHLTLPLRPSAKPNNFRPIKLLHFTPSQQPLEKDKLHYFQTSWLKDGCHVYPKGVCKKQPLM